MRGDGDGQHGERVGELDARLAGHRTSVVATEQCGDDGVRGGVVLARDGLQFVDVAGRRGRRDALRQGDERLGDSLEIARRALGHQVPAHLDALVVDAEDGAERNTLAGPLRRAATELGDVLVRGGGCVADADGHGQAGHRQFRDVGPEGRAECRRAGGRSRLTHRPTSDVLEVAWRHAGAACHHESGGALLHRSRLGRLRVLDTHVTSSFRSASRTSTPCHVAVSLHVDGRLARHSHKNGAQVQIVGQ